MEYGKNEPMTDFDYYTAVLMCYGATAKDKQCGRCPLLRCEIACDVKLMYETQRRRTMAHQEAAQGYKQLSMI